MSVCICEHARMHSLTCVWGAKTKQPSVHVRTSRNKEKASNGVMTSRMSLENRHRIAERAKKTCFQKSLHNAMTGLQYMYFSAQQHWPHYEGAKYSAANQLLRHVFSAFTILKRERMRGETEPVEVWRRHHEGARKTERKSCGLKLRKIDGCRVTPLVRAIDR